MNANNFVNNAVPIRNAAGELAAPFPLYRQSQWGFTAGGPIFIPG